MSWFQIAIVVKAPERIYNYAMNSLLQDDASMNSPYVIAPCPLARAP